LQKDQHRNTLRSLTGKKKIPQQTTTKKTKSWNLKEKEEQGGWTR